MPLIKTVVAAAVISRGEEYFVTRRQAGVHLEGFWEFPGGKCEAGEGLEDCLIREIREELDVEIRVGAEILSSAHAYPDRIVELRFFACDFLGEPRPMQGQQMQWVPRGALGSLAFPPADGELLKLIAGQI